MAAHQRYPSVHEQLRDLARAAQAACMPFDVFWEEAVRPGLPPVTWRTPEARRPEGCVIWPNDTFDRQCVRDATVAEDVREGWRRAYYLHPPLRREAALTVLAPMLAGLDAAGRREVMRRGLADRSAVPSAA